MSPFLCYPSRPLKITISEEAACSIHKLLLAQPGSVDGGMIDYFELIWVTHGVGDMWIDLQKTELTSDRIVCLRPGQVRKLESSQEMEGYIIKLSRAFIASVEREVNSLPLVTLLQLFSGSNGIRLTPQVRPILQELINQMDRVLTNTEPLKTGLLNCYIEILLTHLNHHWAGSHDPCSRTRNTELVESFLSLVEKHFKTERSVTKYASWLSVTPSHLNEVTKKLTGYSAGHLIRRRVGLEAKRKAVHTRMCMKEVAYYLGFSDPAHFSKFFKNTTGHNFSNFRKDKTTVSLASIRQNLE
ncbi:MAG TPA: helix-turn-helix domain-containing protein [Chryseolinea sp.]